MERTTLAYSLLCLPLNSMNSAHVCPNVDFVFAQTEKNVSSLDLHYIDAPFCDVVCMCVGRRFQH